MRKELDEALCAKYPKIFKDRHGDMRETAMCWGFSCGDGWYNIIDSACALIQGHIDSQLRHIEFVKKWNEEIQKAHLDDWTFLYEKHKSPKSVEWLNENLEKEKEKYLIELRPVPEPYHQVVASQIKEKYGTLRFYYYGGDQYVDGVVAMAEYLSGLTCEICGNPGKTVGGGWVRTLCRTHAEELNYDYDYQESDYEEKEE